MLAATVSSGSTADILNIVLLGGFLGACGQVARVVIGLKKVNDQAQAESKAFGEIFQARNLVVSLVIGFAAGVLGVLALWPKDGPLTSLSFDDRTVFLALIGSGYAGTDFIEGFMSKNAPATPMPRPPGPVPPGPSPGPAMG